MICSILIQHRYRSGVMLNEDFFMTNFTPGKIVRVNNPESMAYGRFARVMDHMGPEDAKVEFIDGNTGAEMCSMDKYLTSVEGIPPADFYLVVKIATSPDSAHCYHELCLAHGSGQTPAQVADAVAQHWYNCLSQWNEERKAFIFLLDIRIEVAVGNYEEISLAEYIHLRRWMKDCTPVYAAYAGVANGL